MRVLRRQTKLDCVTWLMQCTVHDPTSLLLLSHAAPVKLATQNRQFLDISVYFTSSQTADVFKFMLLFSLHTDLMFYHFDVFQLLFHSVSLLL